MVFDKNVSDEDALLIAEEFAHKIVNADADDERHGVMKEMLLDIARRGMDRPTGVLDKLLGKYTETQKERDDD